MMNYQEANALYTIYSITLLIGIGTIIIYNYNKLYNKKATTDEFIDMIDTMDDDTMHEIILKCSKHILIPNWYSKKYFEDLAKLDISPAKWMRICKNQNQTLLDDINESIVELISMHNNLPIYNSPSDTDSSDSVSSDSDSSDSDYVPSEPSDTDSDDSVEKNLVLNETDKEKEKEELKEFFEKTGC